MTTATLTPDEVIARIGPWQGRAVRWETLGGGITNANYLVTVEGDDGPEAGRYVLRIPGEGTDAFIDRTRELRNHAAAAATGVTPPLLFQIEPGPCTVVPFIDGETMHPTSIAGHPDRLDKIVDAMRTYHAGARFENEIRFFEMLRDYQAMAHDADAPRPAEFDLLERASDEIEAAMSRREPAPVAAHCDLLSENFILDRDGKMWIIDWEYAGRTDPCFDLGDFCVEHPFTVAEKEAMIRRYCGELDERLYYRMLLYEIVCDLWWAVWAMIQSRISKLDFDFYVYGADRARRACVNAANPDYRRWLDGV